MNVAGDLEYYLEREPKPSEIADAEEWLSTNPDGDLSEWVQAMADIGAFDDPVFDPTTCIIIEGGTMDYDIKNAVRDIDDVIALLDSAKREGATHVALTSGNRRGPKWVSVSVTRYGWADDEH